MHCSEYQLKNGLVRGHLWICTKWHSTTNTTRQMRVYSETSSEHLCNKVAGTSCNGTPQAEAHPCTMQPKQVTGPFASSSSS
mmetsp:Transcript_76962/g.160147  ORF Transcript_76962/g.160147 Transcript_76962/m.160147 type:complete len:82 (-) Transcript_76962:393-638(-)